MEGVEGIGEAVTAGMVARAVEPSHGEAGDHDTHCLNCGAGLTGPYCHECGQKGHVHRTIGGFWHELVHGVFHFEGKIWRTLPMLAWRPGELTRRYIHGERARFVSPIALFLFSVFLMFAVFSLLGGPFSVPDVANSPQARAEAEADFQEEQTQDRARLQELRTERQERVQAGRSTTSVDNRIRRTEEEIAARERMFAQAMRLLGADAPREGTQSKTGTPSTAPAARREARPPPAEATAPSDIDVDDAPRPLRWLGHAYQKAQENPALVAYKLQSNAYKFSWALIPISVPFVWMLFLHRRRYRQYRAYDHTVFVTYSIAFMSLGFIVVSLLQPLGLGTIGSLLTVFVPPIHIYRQLRGAYELSRWSALWRTSVLLMFAFIAIALFFSLLVGIGEFG